MPFGADLDFLPTLSRAAPIIIILMIASGPLAHIVYVNRIYWKVASKYPKDEKLSEDKLFKQLSIRQGPTFEFMAKSSWILLFVAVAYYLFLTPVFFDNLNYFEISQMASSELGFFLFGSAFMLIGSLIAGPINKAYSIYEISIYAKKGIMASYLLLAISVISSAYIGTVYPNVDSDLSRLASAVAFITLFISLYILLKPIYRGAIMVIR